MPEPATARERMAKLLAEVLRENQHLDDPYLAMADAVLPLLADARAQAVEECIREIPTTWLDPLLSGPAKVLPNGVEWGGPDIERLLSALVSRLRALLPPSPAPKETR